MHGTPIPDIVSQGVDELLGALDAICITDQGVSATENWAIVDASAMAGVSEKTVSVATASFHLGMLKTGFFCFELLLEIVLG